MIYFIVIIIFIFISFIEVLTKDEKFSNLFGFSSFIFLVFFASLRDNVGADWNSYLEFYKNGTDAVEIGYATLNNIFSRYYIPYFIFLFFINYFSLFLLFKFISRFSNLRNVAFLIFFSDLYLYFNLSGVRQAIAISLTCYSLVYAVKNKFLYFFYCIIFACFFHLTALIFLIAFFIPRNKISISKFILFSLMFIVCFIFLNHFSELITLYTNKNAYFYTSLQVNADNLQNLFMIGIAKRLIVLILIFFFGKNLLDKSNFRYFINIYLFGFILYLSTYMISPDIGVRLSSYFLILEIILVGNMIWYSSPRISLLILSIVSVVAIYKIFGYSSDETYIYKTIINFY